MFTNRFILVLGVASLLLVTMAVSKPFSKASPEGFNEATDFYQRHPDWIWGIKDQNAAIPETGASAFPDYYQRHPELSVSVEMPADTTDYFFRHPNSETLPHVTQFSLQQLRREYILGERYGVTPQGYAEQQALREYWLGEKYGQTP